MKQVVQHGTYVNCETLITQPVDRLGMFALTFDLAGKYSNKPKIQLGANLEQTNKLGFTEALLFLETLENLVNVRFSYPPRVVCCFNNNTCLHEP